MPQSEVSSLQGWISLLHGRQGFPWPSQASTSLTRYAFHHSSPHPMQPKFQAQVIFYTRIIHFPETGMCYFLSLGSTPHLLYLETPCSFHNIKVKCDFLTEAFCYPMIQKLVIFLLVVPQQLILVTPLIPLYCKYLVLFYLKIRWWTFWGWGVGLMDFYNLTLAPSRWVPNTMFCTH